MRSNNRLLLAFLLLLLFCSNAFAQSNNSDPCGNGSTVSYPDKYIGVCGLEGTTTTLPYNNGVNLQGDLPFSVRSGGGIFTFNCNNAVDYQVRIDGAATGNDCLLTGSNTGDQLQVALTFSDIYCAEKLTPNTSSTRLFSGLARGAQSKVNLAVSLFSINPSTQPDTYTGNFQFSLTQGFCGAFFCFPTELAPVDFSISIEVEPMIRISGLEDREFDATPFGVTENQQDFCVYSQGGAPFKLTADSQTGSGVFELSGSLDQIKYETWIQNLTQGSMEQLTEGQASSQSWPGRLYEGCNIGGDNMRITIRILPSALADAMGNSYSDTLTLTVRVE